MLISVMKKNFFDIRIKQDREKKKLVPKISVFVKSRMDVALMPCAESQSSSRG